MPTATATKQAQAEVAVEDVLRPDEWHTLEHIEWSLGVPAETVHAAFRQHRFPQYKIGAGGRYGIMLYGADVLAWLRAEHIPHAPTPEAVALYERVHRTQESQQVQQREKGLLDNAADAAEEMRRREEQEVAELEAQNWRAYLQLLLRHDNPQPNDARELAIIMRDLGLTKADVQEDIETVERARQLMELHARRGELHKRLVAAQQAYHEARARCEAELRQAERARHTAQVEHAQANNAAHELEVLHRRRPEFFTAGNPPRLREVPAESGPKPKTRGKSSSTKQEA